MDHAESPLITLEGTVEPEFVPVRDAFLAGFEQDQELGAAVAVYHRGKPVVDLAGGVCARGSTSKYSRETLQPIFSATKGITALAANILADRGQLDLDAPPSIGLMAAANIPANDRAFAIPFAEGISAACTSGRFTSVGRTGGEIQFKVRAA